MKDAPLLFMIVGTVTACVVLAWIFEENVFNILDAVISVFGWGY